MKLPVLAIIVAACGLLPLAAQAPPPSPSPAEKPPPAKPAAAPEASLPPVAPAATRLPDRPPPPPPLPTNQRDLINVLSDPQLEQATEAIRANFLNPSFLNDRELRRARLEGLLDRLGPGAEISPSQAPDEPSKGHPFLAEVLDGQIGYVRLGGIDKDNLAQMDAVLGDLNAKKIGALILDLRSIPHAADFETAADFARRFAPKGRLLFRIEKPSAKQERIFTSNQDPVFAGTIVALTDEKTGGAAEVLAGALRRAAGGMVIGATTAGKPVEFAAFPLGGGVEVRVAVAEAVLADDERAFPGGVKPDLSVSLPAAIQSRIFELSSARGVSEFIFDRERPRMNEAALIANANPEINGAEEETNGGDPTAGLKDSVLQRAVDVVTALRLFRR